MTEARIIQLPADLCLAVEKKFAGTFASLEELLTVALRELLRDEASRLDAAEQAFLEQRLRELGYL